MEITKKHKTLVTRRGGMGKGCRIYLLGACDHNCNGVNGNSMGPTPRTNGGVQCFDRKTGNKGLDSHREELCNCFGSPMDAVKLTVDDVLREEHGCKCIFDDHTRSESFAAHIREERCKVKGRGLFQFCNFDGWKQWMFFSHGQEELVVLPLLLNQKRLAIFTGR
jgi:hypothetical protein